MLLLEYFAAAAVGQAGLLLSFTLTAIAMTTSLAKGVIHKAKGLKNKLPSTFLGSNKLSHLLHRLPCHGSRTGEFSRIELVIHRINPFQLPQTMEQREGHFCMGIFRNN